MQVLSVCNKVWSGQGRITMGYTEKFFETLSIASENKESYTDMLDEWIYFGEHWKEIGCCVCGHKVTRKYRIRNIKNKLALSVGSCCVQKFIPNKKSFKKCKKSYLELALQLAHTNEEKNVVYHCMDVNNKGWKLNENEAWRLKQITGIPWQFALSSVKLGVEQINKG